jgi:hypothetical protein
MTARNKKRKCKNTMLKNGGEKGKIFKLKGYCMYHKKERIAGKKECKNID